MKTETSKTNTSVFWVSPMDQYFLFSSFYCAYNHFLWYTTSLISCSSFVFHFNCITVCYLHPSSLAMASTFQYVLSLLRLLKSSLFSLFAQHAALPPVFWWISICLHSLAPWKILLILLKAIELTVLFSWCSSLLIYDLFTLFHFHPSSYSYS